jgi:dihydrodipicolinate synthase/N-acetylneuraminate lyase
MLDGYDVEVGPTWVQTSAAKAALAALGAPSGPTRLPLPPLDDAVRETLSQVVMGLAAVRSR